MSHTQVAHLAVVQERKLAERVNTVLAGTIIEGSSVADIQTELALLASILLHNGMTDVVDVLPDREAFYSEAYRRTFGTMLEMHELGQPMEISAVMSRLVETGKLDIPAAREVSNEILSYWGSHAVLPSTQPRALALSLRAVWTRRKLASLAIELQARAHHIGEDMPLDGLLSLAQTRLEAITEASGGGSKNITAKAGLISLARSWKDAKVVGLAVGIPAIDRCMGGMGPKKTTLIAARTSVGKTMLAQMAAINVARKDEGVFFVSLEMMAEHLLARMVACIGAVDSKVALNTMPGDAAAQHKVHTAMMELANLPIEVWPSQNATMADIFRGAADSQKSFAKAGKRLSLVVIDHVHLVRHTGDQKTPRHEQVAAVSRQARLLADRLNVHVILLAQCSRESEKSRGKSGESSAPQMHHIAESDKLAQDADSVLILHAPRDANGQWVDRPGSLILAKCRYGEIGACDVKIIREWQRIREVDSSGYSIEEGGF